MTLASLSGTGVRRLVVPLLAVMLAVVLALGGLAWQIDQDRGRMLGLLEQELAAMRHTVPSPSRMAATRAEFDRLHSAMAWRLRAASALGLLGLGLAISLVLAAAGANPVINRRGADFRTVPARR